MNIGEVELARNLRVMTKLIGINQLILLILKSDQKRQGSSVQIPHANINAESKHLNEENIL